MKEELSLYNYSISRYSITLVTTIHYFSYIQTEKLEVI